MNLCPCGSNKLYAACCGLHLAGAPAPTAEKLMRSRYTAYATGDLDYIERTCAGPAAKAFNKSEAILSNAGTEWLGLEIMGTVSGLETDETGIVSFTFKCRQNGQQVSQSEVSSFRKIGGVWLYWDRQESLTGNVGRNDPCPCGSGKKFKKCCGAQ